MPSNTKVDVFMYTDMNMYIYIYILMNEAPYMPFHKTCTLFGDAGGNNKNSNLCAMKNLNVMNHFFL